MLLIIFVITRGSEALLELRIGHMEPCLCSEVAAFKIPPIRKVTKCKPLPSTEYGHIVTTFKHEDSEACLPVYGIDHIQIPSSTSASIVKPHHPRPFTPSLPPVARVLVRYSGKIHCV